MASYQSASFKKAKTDNTGKLGEGPERFSLRVLCLLLLGRSATAEQVPANVRRGKGQEFLKLYVAFKAETNFVDVVPQAKRLRLSLNMRFAQVDDPKGLCKDVTGIGRWGNGDVEIGLSNPDELPYVLGLVRQSLELQLGNSVDA